ncbi:hypothetical protein, partial [Mycobacterium tuberculosis]|uniref:hypothetical protein n=1 Tax=Mycobacterium tuberculosis TaxID=1773 RepID=UPI001BDB98CE
SWQVSSAQLKDLNPGRRWPSPPSDTTCDGSKTRHAADDFEGKQPYPGEACHDHFWAYGS